MHIYPDDKVHGANMCPTWVLSAPDVHHVGPWTLLSGFRPDMHIWVFKTFMLQRPRMSAHFKFVKFGNEG